MSVDWIVTHQTTKQTKTGSNTRDDEQKKQTDCNGGFWRHNTQRLPLQTPYCLQRDTLHPRPTIGI